MKEILILAVLCAAAYFFRNYQTFGEQNLRPLAVQWNYDREGNPQTLCDLLAPTAQVKIDDKFPRFEQQFTGYKEQACKYFNEAASHFAKPYKDKNGYIDVTLIGFSISDIDYVRGTASLEYSWVSNTSQYGLKSSKKGGLAYTGKSTTKMKLLIRPFKDLQATYYEFTRKLEASSIKR